MTAPGIASGNSREGSTCPPNRGVVPRGGLCSAGGGRVSLDGGLNSLVLVAGRLARAAGPGHARLFVVPVDPRGEEEVPRTGLDGAGPREQEVRDRIPHDSKTE